MNKKEAQDQLNNLQKEVDKLKKIIETPEFNWKQVRGFESACELNNQSAYTIEKRWKNAELTNYQIEHLKLEYCIKTINEGWTPNWNNSNEYKWYNWLEKKSSGCVGCLSSYLFSDSYMGFSLYYETEEKAKHGIKYFLNYYNSILG